MDLSFLVFVIIIIYILMYRLALARACQRLKITLYFCLTKEAPACIQTWLLP